MLCSTVIVLMLTIVWLGAPDEPGISWIFPQTDGGVYTREGGATAVHLFANAPVRCNVSEWCEDSPVPYTQEDVAVRPAIADLSDTAHVRMDMHSRLRARAPQCARWIGLLRCEGDAAVHVGLAEEWPRPRATLLVVLLGIAIAGGVLVDAVRLARLRSLPLV